MINPVQKTEIELFDPPPYSKENLLYIFLI